MPSEIDLFRQYIVAQRHVELGQPATDQEITAFETRHNVKLPADVKEYFLKINGVYVSGGFITLEPLSEWGLMVEHQYYDPERINQMLGKTDKYFRFGAYDILVWNWLIKLDSNPETETPIFVLYDKVTKIADNFADFLRKYRQTSPEKLLGH